MFRVTASCSYIGLKLVDVRKQNQVNMPLAILRRLSVVRAAGKTHRRVADVEYGHGVLHERHTEDERPSTSAVNRSRAEARHGFPAHTSIHHVDGVHDEFLAAQKNREEWDYSVTLGEECPIFIQERSCRLVGVVDLFCNVFTKAGKVSTG